jgi:hypothetical protein
MSLDASVPAYSERYDWPTPPVLTLRIKDFGRYRDGGPQGGTVFVDLEDSAGTVFPFFFDRFLGRLCYGTSHHGSDDAAFIRRGSKFESEVFSAIETAALAPEFSEVAKCLSHARHWTGPR